MKQLDQTTPQTAYRLGLYFFCIFCFAAIANPASVSASTAGTLFDVQVIDRDRVLVSLRPFDIETSTHHSQGQTYNVIRVPGFGQRRFGGVDLPVLGLLLNLPAGTTPTIRVLEAQYDELPGISLRSAPDEQADSIAVAQEPPEAKLVEFESWGIVRGANLTRLEVRPIRYDPVSQKLWVCRGLKFELTLPGQAARLELGLRSGGHLHWNAKSAPGDLPTRSKPDLRSQSDDWYNPAYTYYKMRLKQDGIYAVTLADLQAVNGPSQLPRESLKIYQGGAEIPIWIDGPESTLLNPEHVIYFYADRHDGDSTYFDFYADETMAWLTADGGAGLRYIEEQAPGAVLNPESLYSETLHLEEDKLFHVSDRSTTIESDEGWIWRYFFDNDSEIIRFDLAGLPVRAATCSLRLRLHGTTLDPVNPDHHIRLTLNNVSIGDAFFDDQQELLLALPVSSEHLIEGENQLKVQLVADTGAEINQVYLDWLEFQFPRVPAAVDGQLSIHGESSLSNPGMFSVFNFGTAAIRFFNPNSSKLLVPAVHRTSFYRVQSAAFEDGGQVRMLVDFATFEGIDRGHNLLAITEGKTIIRRSFDTFGSTDAANEMADFINELPEGAVVLAGIADEGSVSMTEAAHMALESLGSRRSRDVGFRDSWALIGWKGAAPGSAIEELARRAAGPAIATGVLKDDQAFAYAASIQTGPGPGDIYHAFSLASARPVSRIELDRSSNLRDLSLQADYIVITHSLFREQAERLAAYRQAYNGFRTLVVDIEDIYDEFNSGIVHPTAIKEFLGYAYEHWQRPAPSYVLLFGDASWDPRRLLPQSDKVNYIPSYGILVSDTWYALLDGPEDFLPDMFIGRLPVENPEQADVVVDKIMAYESTPFGTWNKKLLFLNGGINNTEQSIFRSQAQALVSNYLDPPPFTALVEHLNKNTNEAITQNLRRAVGARINEGVLWVNFLGHAASTVWDIDIGHPDEWQNDLLPFVTGMSCHSARFANPSINSLGEQYVLNPIGACAYWGSSGFGYVIQDFFLLQGLFLAVVQDSVRSLGEATTLAKIDLWRRLGDQERNRFVIQQYTLIGDPALQLRVPRAPELAVSPGDVIVKPDFLLTSGPGATVTGVARNFGLMPEDSIEVEFSAIGPDNQTSPISTLKRPAFANRDSVSIDWPSPGTPGEYVLQMEVDPLDRIAEVDELNNAAQKTVQFFTSDISLIKPMDFGVVRSRRPQLITNNSRAGGQDLLYFFELDSSLSFASPLLQQSPPVSTGHPVTSWTPDLPAQGEYYWRIRTFDGGSYGPWREASFSYLVNETSQWRQAGPGQFGRNERQSIAAAAGGGIHLARQEFIYEALSAGFIDGNRAVLIRNNEVVSSNERGHNLAVFDQVDGRLVASRNYDTFASIQAADTMAQFIESIPEGQVVLVAIKDEGSSSLSERAHRALESIGSMLTRSLGYRDSWAIIGRKGALPGSVREALAPAGQGGVAIADTLTSFYREGSMLSGQIGPAMSWSSVHFDYADPTPGTAIRFRVLGFNSATGKLDTLGRAPPDTREISLTDLDPEAYPFLQLLTWLTSSDGTSSPRLDAWRVRYSPRPDLVISRLGSQAPDSLLRGDLVKTDLIVGNFGFASADSVLIRASSTLAGGENAELAAIQVGDLPVDSFRTVPLRIASDLLGRRAEILVELDPLNEVLEFDETNNSLSFIVAVLQDTIAPEIHVTFDGQVVAEGEFVSSKPEIRVRLEDVKEATADDTARVRVVLDGRKVEIGEGEVQAHFLLLPDEEDGRLRSHIVYTPDLDTGEHILEVFAEDEPGNLALFRLGFVVSSDFLLTNVMNYPNPFRTQTDFTYILTQDADVVRLKIYTIAGRLIHEFDFLPGHVGFNRFNWDGRDFDGDVLANGVYLYKLIAKSGDQQVEIVDKFAVMR